MKRSEMIEQIEKYLLKEFFEGVPKDLNGAWDSYKSASNILDICEYLGMLPPSTDYFINNCLLEMNWDSINDYHLWEPDNE